MIKNIARPLLAATLLALAAGAAQTDQIAVTSYDTPNGDGQAHGGTYNYWDTPYNGSASAGATNIDGITTGGNALSGGTGKLTDGVIASDYWANTSNSAGTGPWVGWLQSPTITFHFAGNVDLTEIKFYVDNSGQGGVSAPDAVIVDGVSFANTLYQTPGGSTTLSTIDITGLDLHSDSVTVTLQQSNAWVFLSEVQFFSSTSAVPETGNLAMMLGGLSLLGFMARRRRG